LSFQARLRAGKKEAQGCTVNVSSCGALVVTDAPVPVEPGSRVEVAIDWPLPSEGAPVQLRLWGSVAWTRERLVAVDAKRYSFHVGIPRVVSGNAMRERRNPFYRKSRPA
jgi:hypothetical protein